MTFIRLYGRVLGLLAADRKVAISLGLAAILLAGLQFIEPIIFGRVIDLLTRSDRMAESALLAEAAGPTGMVGGQVLDISAVPAVDAATLDTTLLTEIHARKTGALIRVAVEGTAVLLNASAEQQRSLRQFGKHLGLAFQLADDIEDYDPDAPEKINFATHEGGVAPTRHRLAAVSRDAEHALADFPADADGLRQMVRLNQERV